MEENDRAYWTHEVAEQVGIGESTLRKWCLELEKNEYRFTKGEQESRAFLKKDIDLLIWMKNEIRGRKKSIKDTAKIATKREKNNEVIASNLATDQERTPLVPLEQTFTLEDVREIIKQELHERDRTIESKQEERAIERDKNLIEVMRELQEVKKMIAASQETSLKSAQKKWWEFWK